MSGFESRLDSRKKGFKKNCDVDDTRRQRENEALQIRKQAKDMQMTRRRKMGGGEDTAGKALGPANQADVEKLPEMVEGLYSDDPKICWQATQMIRRLLSIERSPPIDPVIQSGAVSRLVSFLQEDSQPELQFEAAWTLTNIASGNEQQTKVVVDHGTIPIFVKLVQSPNMDVKEQAVWALGNIAGDSAKLRDVVLDAGVLPPLLSLLREVDKTSVLRNATWALSNLCRGKPQPDLAKEAGFWDEGAASGTTEETEGARSPSTKMTRLRAYIRRDVSRGRRVVVFSQWRRFLRLIGGMLAADRIPCRVWDGSLSPQQRREGLQWLAEAGAGLRHGPPPPPDGEVSADESDAEDPANGRVLLVSLKAGGVGLNLTAASRLYLMDLWWNPAVEDQAMQRVHRIGQKRKVRIYRFAVADSIDERILELQERKRQLVEDAIGAGDGTSVMPSTRISLKDLQDMFRAS